MKADQLGVPDYARAAWDELHATIRRTGPTPCSGDDRDEWNGSAAEQERAARACLDCAAMTECAAYALRAGERTGTWGGRTQQERWPTRKGAQMT